MVFSPATRWSKIVDRNVAGILLVASCACQQHSEALSRHSNHLRLNSASASFAQSAGQARNPLIDPTGCRAFVDRGEATYEKC
jgi:hypothetical protein